MQVPYFLYFYIQFADSPEAPPPQEETALIHALFMPHYARARAHTHTHTHARARAYTYARRKAASFFLTGDVENLAIIVPSNY